MITDAQAETIRELRQSYWNVGMTFQPTEAFPSHDNADNGHRRTLRRLAGKGILGRGDFPGELRVTQATVDAYDEWYRKRGFKLDY